MKVKVAAVQFAPVLGQKEANLKVIAEMVAQAAGEGAELVVLPELATTGYSFLSDEEARPLAEVVAPDGATLRALLNLAAKHRVHLVCGMMELDAGAATLHNAQVYVDPDGYYTSYRKINLWGNDYCWAKEGRANPPVISVNFAGTSRKVGMVICRDVRDKKNDKWSSFFTKGETDIVCLSANWGDGGYPAVAWMDFVQSNKTALVVSNRYGKETCNDFGEGGICVIEPGGKVITKGLVWSAPCIVYAEV